MPRQKRKYLAIMNDLMIFGLKNVKRSYIIITHDIFLRELLLVL